MKKFIALCLLTFNIAASALAAEIPYIGRVQPEYRAAAEGYLIEATSPQDVELRVKNYVPAQSSITFETVNAKSLYGAADAALPLKPLTPKAFTAQRMCRFIFTAPPKAAKPNCR